MPGACVLLSYSVLQILKSSNFSRVPGLHVVKVRCGCSTRWCSTRMTFGSWLRLGLVGCWIACRSWLLVAFCISFSALTATLHHIARIHCRMLAFQLLDKKPNQILFTYHGLSSAINSCKAIHCICIYICVTSCSPMGAYGSPGLKDSRLHVRPQGHGEWLCRVLPGGICSDLGRSNTK